MAPDTRDDARDEEPSGGGPGHRPASSHDASARSKSPGNAVPPESRDAVAPESRGGEGWPLLSALDLEVCLSTPLPGRSVRTGGHGKEGHGEEEPR